MELVSELLTPPLAQIRRRDDQQLPTPLRPLLGEQQPRLNGLAEANLISKNCTLREGRPKREQRGVDLVRIEIHLGVRERCGKFLDAVRRAAQAQFVSEQLRMMGSEGFV